MKEFRIGDRLVQAGVISEEQRDFALNEQKRTGEQLGVILSRLNLITEDELTRIVAEGEGIEHILLRSISIDPKIKDTMPEAFVRRYKAFPIAIDDGTVTVAMSNPLDVSAIDRIQQQVNRYVKVVSATEFDVLTTIDKYYGTQLQAVDEMGGG